eukprot:scaffold9196_cov110-Isochrysis_galbana.AAC.11
MRRATSVSSGVSDERKASSTPSGTPSPASVSSSGSVGDGRNVVPDCRHKGGVTTAGLGSDGEATSSLTPILRPKPHAPACGETIAVRASAKTLGCSWSTVTCSNKRSPRKPTHRTCARGQGVVGTAFKGRVEMSSCTSLQTRLPA